MPASKSAAVGKKTKPKSKEVVTLKKFLVKKQGKGEDKAVKPAKAVEKEKCRKKVEEITKKGQENRKKKEKDATGKTPKEKHSEQKSEPKGKSAERAGILKRKQGSSDGPCPKTPPTKRVHFKSPSPDSEKVKDDALRKILKKSELCAELDGAGMSAFLEYIKEKHPAGGQEGCSAQEPEEGDGEDLARCHLCGQAGSGLG